MPTDNIPHPTSLVHLEDQAFINTRSPSYTFSLAVAVLPLVNYHITQGLSLAREGAWTRSRSAFSFRPARFLALASTNSPENYACLSARYLVSQP